MKLSWKFSDVTVTFFFCHDGQGKIAMERMDDPAAAACSRRKNGTVAPFGGGRGQTFGRLEMSDWWWKWA